MVLAISILLLAVGVLLWVIDRSASGVEGSMIGGILIALGGVGLLGSLLVSARAASGRRAPVGGERDVLAPAEDEPAEDETWPVRARRHPPR